MNGGWITGSHTHLGSEAENDAFVKDIFWNMLLILVLGLAVHLSLEMLLEDRPGLSYALPHH